MNPRVVQGSADHQERIVIMVLAHTLHMIEFVLGNRQSGIYIRSTVVVDEVFSEFFDK